VESVKDNTGLGTQISSKAKKIVIYLTQLKEEDKLVILNVLEQRFSSIFSNKPSFKFERDFIRQQDEKSAHLLVIIIGVLFNCFILFVVLQKYEMRQLDSDWFLAISISLSLLMVFVFAYRFKTPFKKSRPFALALLCILTFTMSLSSILSFLNQLNDESFSNKRVISLIEDKEFNHYNKQRDFCYLINEEKIKDSSSWQICRKQNPLVSETSTVVVSFKKGNLGQRWIASVKLIEGDKESSVNFNDK
jgi:hypothetical protein